MPGAMHRMGVYLGLVEEDESGYADGYGHGYADDARGNGYGPAHVNGHGHGGAERTPSRPHDRAADYGDERFEAAAVARYEERVDLARPAYDQQQPTYQITALHPRTYNEARTIGEQFRNSTPVIMNLSEMDDADAKRLVDFAAGLTFGLHGRIERVTAKVFLLSPHNVTVTAQDKARIAESGFFNQS